VLLLYLIFRTYLCFKLMAETQAEWIQAYKDMRTPISVRRGEAKAQQARDDEGYSDAPVPING